MQTRVFTGFGLSVAFAASVLGCVDQPDDPEMSQTEELLGYSGFLPSGLPIFNSAGYSTTISTAPQGRLDLTNPFFQNLGTNDRRCVSCHLPTAGWTITPQQLGVVFALTSGGKYNDGLALGAVFRPNDGTNSPNADVSTLSARRNAYSMLLTRGTIRVGLPMPESSEFDLIAVDDPYHFASANELSMFRRPLPATNLTQIATVMWDGRVTGATIDEALGDQSNGATMGHAQALEPLTAEQRAEIVGFESKLVSAQEFTVKAGKVTAENARGGAEALATQEFVASRFNLFDAWAASSVAKRQAVFRGQELFNTRIRVGTTAGTCRACHSGENSGTNKNGSFFNVGTSDGARREADQPLYTFQNRTTLVTITSTDPGRALITGKWADMNKFKVPSMRGLASRAPYFHGGSSKTLLDLVKFYEDSLKFEFTAAEEADLVAFMEAL